ncbi:MAG TPA: DUF922 domain-containing protein [Flavisolibacter sp.]|nr:DUF922 domain-containing protein [Flavisolibacter sp.]
MPVRIFITFLFITIFCHLNAQKVIINGKEGNRPLVWADFTGSPDNSSPYFAYTYWSSKFSFSGARFNGDVAIIDGFECTLQLNPQESWVKPGKQSEELLKHEQGHFNVGLLYIKDVVKKIKAASFTRANYQAEIKAILNEAHKKYVEMGNRYDEETAHSSNREQQGKWNVFFSKELQ